MAKKKLTRLEKSTAILKLAKATQWCYVNTENEFDFMDKTFIVSTTVKEYKVHNKAGEVEDYTNEAEMESILATIDQEDRLQFFNQNYDLVESRLIRVKE